MADPTSDATYRGRLSTLTGAPRQALRTDPLAAMLQRAGALADLLIGFQAHEERDPGFYALGNDTLRLTAEAILLELLDALDLLQAQGEGRATEATRTRTRARSLAAVTEAITDALSELAESLSDPGTAQAPATVWELQFVSDLDDADGYWCVTPTRKPAQGFAEGVRFGTDFIAYLRRSQSPGTPQDERLTAADALGNILIAMSHRPDTADHLRGFGHALTDAIAGRRRGPVAVT